MRASHDGVMPTPQELAKRNVAINGTWSSLTDEGEATNLNLIHVSKVDATNVLELTYAEMEGRRQLPLALAGLRHAVPGFERSKLRNIGTAVGVRDTRKILGRYNMTKQDVLGQARFPESSIGIYPEFVDGYAILLLGVSGRYYHVPYGILVPKDEVHGLLVAGRCVAGDSTSHASLRNMSACCCTGQGAGVAAAVAVRTGASTVDVDVKLVQEELVRQGVRVR